MRVKFKRQFDYRHHPAVTESFPEGAELTVKKEIGEAAIKSGAAEAVAKSDADKGTDAAPEQPA